MGLFVTEDTLKERLRLSRIPDSSGAGDLLLEASLTVRLGFMEELGSARVAAIVALPFTETPTTTDEILAAVAHTTEVKWTRLELSRTLPMLFADGNQDNGQIFHDEAAFRQAKEDQLESLRGALWEEVVVGVSRMQGSTVAEDRNEVRFAAITPDCPPPAPGDTGRPRYPLCSTTCCTTCGCALTCCVCP